MPAREAGPRPAGRAVAAVLVAAALFGTTGTAQALGPAGTTPLGVGAARIALGGVVLLCLLPLLGGDAGRAVVLWRRPAGVTAGLCTAAYQLCFFAAVQATGVALGTVLAIGSGPVFAGLLAWGLLHERPGRAWMAATGSCVAGIALLAGVGAAGTGAAATGGAGAAVQPVGPILALGAGLAYAGYTVAARRLITTGDHSATVMGSAFGLGAVLVVPVLLTQPLRWLATPSGAVLVAYLGVVTIALAYVLFGRGLRALPAGPVTTLVLAEPLVATLLGVAVLHERLTAPAVLGTALVVVGLAVQGAAAAGGGRPGGRRVGPVGGRRTPPIAGAASGRPAPRR